MVHNVPLGKGNIRVAVNYALQGDSPLPIPVKGVLETVEDAIGSQVAWPQDLIVFDDKVKKRETTKEKLARLYSSLYHQQCQSLASYLFRLVKSQQRDQVIGFMDPARTAHDPRDGNLRSEYITKCLKQTSIDSIFLIPFNPGGHWILTIIDEDKDNVYVMDPLGARHPHDAWKTVWDQSFQCANWETNLGAPKQSDGKSCGYFVMRYMKDICKDLPLNFEISIELEGRTRTPKWNWMRCEKNWQVMS
ncbi:uncharacterized protein Pyn_14040 [Prunus yedoensis var. nudiflora]|uniref:Uncharacterized protein n=1 Tax=Prunus yedoensis var. nudiflora TaxID=2094558 RepID=A0A314YI77_PRUYE|nr:uncharacterized protein Pyn_14040 [Prunus yedoensis var. nudiflora]